jgi:biotin-(acetyl-CoA carboxylase) ligase
MLLLPPPYTLVALREIGDVFARACALAQEKGAGTFVFARRFDVLEFAVVLEPEEPLASARRAVFAGMNALADALSSFAPPEKPVTFAWPVTIRFDGARLGGGRLGWPEACAEDEVPDWLVFSAQLLAAKAGEVEPGAHPDATWLEEEGFDTSECHAIVESFSRHLMTAFDRWNAGGFAAVAKDYLARLPNEESGGRRGIDENGDLLIHGAGGVERIPLLPGLSAPEWLDPRTGAPRL